MPRGGAPAPPPAPSAARDGAGSAAAAPQGPAAAAAWQRAGTSARRRGGGGERALSRARPLPRASLAEPAAARADWAALGEGPRAPPPPRPRPARLAGAGEGGGGGGAAAFGAKKADSGQSGRHGSPAAAAAAAPPRAVRGAAPARLPPAHGRPGPRAALAPPAPLPGPAPAAAHASLAGGARGGRGRGGRGRPAALLRRPGALGAAAERPVRPHPGAEPGPGAPRALPGAGRPLLRPAGGAAHGGHGDVAQDEGRHHGGDNEGRVPGGGPGRAPPPAGAPPAGAPGVPLGPRNPPVRALGAVRGPRARRAGTPPERGLGAQGRPQPPPGPALPPPLLLPRPLPLLRPAAALRALAPPTEPPGQVAPGLRERALLPLQQLLRLLPVGGHGHPGRLGGLPAPGAAPLGPGGVPPPAGGAAPLHGRRRHQLEPAHVPMAAHLRVPEHPAPGDLRGRSEHVRGQRPAARPQLPPGRHLALPRPHHLLRARAPAAPGRHLGRVRARQALPPRLQAPEPQRLMGPGGERGPRRRHPLPLGLSGRPVRRRHGRRHRGAGVRHGAHAPEVVGVGLGQSLGHARLPRARAAAPLTRKRTGTAGNRPELPRAARSYPEEAPGRPPEVPAPPSAGRRARAPPLPGPRRTRLLLSMVPAAANGGRRLLRREVTSRGRARWCRALLKAPPSPRRRPRLAPPRSE